MCERPKTLTQHNDPEYDAQKAYEHLLLACLGLKEYDERTAAPVPITVADGYEDFGYTPSISKVKSEVFDKFDKYMEKTFSKDFIDNQSTEGEESLRIILSYTKGKASDLDARAAVSKFTSFMKDSPFWNENPYGELWHIARMESAFLQIGKLSRQYHEALDHLLHVPYGIATLLLIKGGADQEHLDAPYACSKSKRNEAIRLQEEMAELYFKIGFLYRDNWWDEKHGRAAISHYTSVEKRTKASGQKSASKKQQRIGEMLSYMEDIFSKNPDLRTQDTLETLADLAIKKAANAKPKLWRQGKNQRDNYLSEMRTNPDLRPRYLKMFPKSA